MASEIFFNLQYRATEYYKNIPSNQNLQQVNTTDMYEYYERDEACDKTICDTEDAFDYYNYRIGSTGGFNDKGTVSREDYFKKMKQYKPKIIYRGVFSFHDDFAVEQDIKDPNKMRDLIKKTMKKNIIAMGFEPDNVEWFAFYHTNTSQPHVHFHFYEKIPKKKKYIISENRLTKVKSNVARLMKLNTELYTDREELKNRIFNKFNDLGLSTSSQGFILATENNNKDYFKENRLITSKLKDLEKVIPKTGSLKYNSANIAPYKKQIEEIIELVKNRSDVRLLMDEFENQLDKEMEAYTILYGGSKEDDMKLKFREKRMNTIDSRLGNMILSTIKNYRKDVETYEQMFEDLEEGDQFRKYRTQRLKGISNRNIRQRASNLIAGMGKELSSSLEQSHFSELKMKAMIDSVQRRAQQEGYRSQHVQ